MKLTKREQRQRWSQLRELMCDWDPIGIMDHANAPRDEYDCLIGPLLTQLAASASEADIAKYLRNQIHHFGLSATDYDFNAVAKRVQAWYDLGWRETRELDTVYVALLNDGVDQWRLVEARSLGRNLFRLIGADEDVSDESWQFPIGAVVRCEMKVFDEGTVGLRAIERCVA
jgi:hypothetical protein